MPKTVTKTVNSKKRKEDKLVNKLLTLNEESIRTYQGNPLLKRAGEKVEFTSEHIKEYKKCMDDPIYFAENYIKIVHVDKGLIPIELYDYQKRIIKALQEYRYNIVLSCRQSGKCCSINTIIRLKHPSLYNGEPFEITIGEFYEWLKFRKDAKEVFSSK